MEESNGDYLVRVHVLDIGRRGAIIIERHRLITLLTENGPAEAEVASGGSSASRV